MKTFSTNHVMKQKYNVG